MPTADTYTAHTWLHPSQTTAIGASQLAAAAGGSGKEAAVHVDNPLSGTWFLLVAARPAGDSGTGGLESHAHSFVRSERRADYAVAFTASGCVRGRQVLASTPASRRLGPGGGVLWSRPRCFDRPRVPAAATAGLARVRVGLDAAVVGAGRSLHRGADAGAGQDAGPGRVDLLHVRVSPSRCESFRIIRLRSFRVIPSHSESFWVDPIMSSHDDMRKAGSE